MGRRERPPWLPAGHLAIKNVLGMGQMSKSDTCLPPELVACPAAPRYLPVPRMAFCWEEGARRWGVRLQWPWQPHLLMSQKTGLSPRTSPC